MNLLPFALLLATASAAAQQQAPSVPPTAASATPDIAILASVRATELHFEEKPDVRVRVWGEVNNRPAATISTTDRQNLPNEVQPYVTYRDIGILLTITSTLADIETILDEALAPAAPASPTPATEAPAAKPTPRKKKSRR